MATIPPTKGGTLTCEPSQLGSVISHSDGTVDAKCENVPASLGIASSDRGGPHVGQMNSEQINWILFKVFGLERPSTQLPTIEERKLIENLGGEFIHPVLGDRVFVSITLPTTTNERPPRQINFDTSSGNQGGQMQGLS